MLSAFLLFTVLHFPGLQERKRKKSARKSAFEKQNFDDNNCTKIHISIIWRKTTFFPRLCHLCPKTRFRASPKTHFSGNSEKLAQKLSFRTTTLSAKFFRLHFRVIFGPFFCDFRRSQFAVKHKKTARKSFSKMRFSGYFFISPPFQLQFFSSFLVVFPDISSSKIAKKRLESANRKYLFSGW